MSPHSPGLWFASSGVEVGKVGPFSMPLSVGLYGKNVSLEMFGVDDDDFGKENHWEITGFLTEKKK
jgi:hypothetical protein